VGAFFLFCWGQVCHSLWGASSCGTVLPIENKKVNPLANESILKLSFIFYFFLRMLFNLNGWIHDIFFQE
jgi:hypothetical protein